MCAIYAFRANFSKSPQTLSSKRPIIYAGGGIISSGASSELIRLSNYTTIPVTTTVMGLGGFPGSHKNNIGMLGMHGTAYANFAINGNWTLSSFSWRYIFCTQSKFVSVIYPFSYCVNLPYKNAVLCCRYSVLPVGLH